jgi:hypothetical protein
MAADRKQDRHKNNPMSFRPPKDIRDWIKKYAEEAGLPESQIVIVALKYYRARAEGKA